MPVNSINCCSRPNNMSQTSQVPSFGYIKMPTNQSNKGFTGNQQANSNDPNLEKKYDLACRYIAVQNQIIHNLQKKN